MTERLDWERNHRREGLRGENEPKFEWYTAYWWMIAFHVHNMKNGAWTVIVQGYKRSEYKKPFDTKDGAIAYAERLIELSCASFRKDEYE